MSVQHYRTLSSYIYRWKEVDNSCSWLRLKLPWNRGNRNEVYQWIHWQGRHVLDNEAPDNLKQLLWKSKCQLRLTPADAILINVSLIMSFRLFSY